ncbi:MAG: ferritin-like domain-containing protein [Candidatus Angelobacter sp.]
MGVETSNTLEELEQIRKHRAINRRNFIRNLGITGVAIAGSNLLAGCGSSTIASAAGPAESDVLNFALNLEYLEAEFYLFATTGAGLSAGDTGAATGPTTGGSKVTFTDPRLADIAAEITFDEQQHVRFLRSALGAAAVPKPAINLAALGPFTNDTQFLTLSRAFEDTGVSAYSGAATLLSGNNLQAAAQILATEALHTGNIRLKVVQAGLSLAPIDALDKPPSGAQYFNVDQNALAIKRTPSQVLAIVYAASTPGTTKGGFFPNGVNGVINTV